MVDARARYDFAGRTAVVTGASRGIGEACVRRLDTGGARVALVARSGDDMRRIAADLRNDPVVITADLADEDQAVAAAEEVLARFGHVDMLVNNAGMGWNEPPEAITKKRLDLQLALNLGNLILFTSALTNSLVQRQGAIVNVSSVAAWGGGPRQAVYAATKGGVNSYTANLAHALGARGVRVNCVAPGFIDTQMWDFPGADAPGVRESLVRAVPLGRWGKSEEIASVVCFLCSDDASYLTGQTLRIDGGLA
jgi:3-oxoacyl-[acyl-carrier protein] reductase